MPKGTVNPLAGGRKRRTALNEDLAFEARIQEVNRKLGLSEPIKQDMEQAEEKAEPVSASSQDEEGKDREPVKLTLVLPGYVHDAMDAYCREHGGRRWTKRFLVLKALNELGVDIDPADLVEDGRRARHKKD